MRYTAVSCLVQVQMHCQVAATTWQIFFPHLLEGCCVGCTFRENCCRFSVDLPTESMGLGSCSCMSTADAIQDWTEGNIEHEYFFCEIIVLQVQMQADASIDASSGVVLLVCFTRTSAIRYGPGNRKDGFGIFVLLVHCG